MKEPQYEKSADVSVIPTKEVALTESHVTPVNNESGPLSLLRTQTEARSYIQNFHWNQQPSFFYFYLIATGFIFAFSIQNSILHMLVGVNLTNLQKHNPDMSTFNLCLWQPVTCFYLNESILQIFVNSYLIWIYLFEEDPKRGSTQNIVYLNLLSKFIFYNNRCIFTSLSDYC